MLDDFTMFLMLCCPRLLNRQTTTRLLKRHNSKRYHAKKQIVKTLWIAAALVMLSFPLLSFIVSLSLFTTFLSFTILDESS